MEYPDEVEQEGTAYAVSVYDFRKWIEERARTRLLLQGAVVPTGLAWTQLAWHSCIYSVLFVV